MANAAAPSVGNPPAKRRWLRYSLRTFFLLVTILCLLLGAQVARRLRHEAAFAALSQLGTVGYSLNSGFAAGFRYSESPPEPRWVRMLVGDEHFGEHVIVNLGSQSVDPSLTAPTRECTDEDLKLIADLPNVDMVRVSSSLVTDRGVRYLAGLRKLTTLDLRLPQLTDEGLRSLEGMKKLNDVRLDGTRVTPAGMERLKRAFPGMILINRDDIGPHNTRLREY